MIQRSWRDYLSKYDWLHLHHEDFTGQYGKFWASFKNEPWYIEQQIESEKLARNLGYSESKSTKGSRCSGNKTLC